MTTFIALFLEPVKLHEIYFDRGYVYEVPSCDPTMCDLGQGQGHLL